MDEIETTALPLEIDEETACIWGQVLCYAYMVARQRSLPRLEVQLTYCRL